MASAGQLEALADIEELSPLVTRILGQNPGPYTLQGTNTYLVGRRGGPAILLDTGQGSPAYVPHIRKALQTYTAVSDIILTHYHHDHVLGLEQVLPLLGELRMPPPRIHKMPAREAQDKPIHDLLQKLPKDAFAPALASSAVHHLVDKQVFHLASDPDSELQILHTPGHTDDSVSVAFKNGSGEGRKTVLFTGDMVLGQGTAVFTDLKALIDSLRRCIDICESAGGSVKLYCGHGPAVADGAAKMEEYIAHRMQRERQVLEALRVASRPQTAADLVRAIYGPELPDKLLQAAQNGILLHLEKVQQEGKVERADAESSPLWKLAR